MTNDAKARSSKGPTSTPHTDCTKFGAAIVAAKGEWVEIDVGKEAKGGNRAHMAAQRGIALEVAELTRKDGILYGRMRT